MIWRKAKARSVVLNVLANGGWWSGLEICRAARVTAGATYAVLTDLENEGLVEAEWADLEPGRNHRRRMYRHAAFAPR